MFIIHLQVLILFLLLILINIMPSLQDIAKQITSLAQLNLTRGSTKAYKTGNLFKKIGSYNTPSRMIKQNKLSFEIDLDYAPPGAEYGQYVNNGTSRMKARPFADEAMEDPTVISMMNQYYEDLVDTVIVENIQKELNMFDDIE